ncbi:MAG: SUMF1/EgtB/PvdO family nonheme iron enzyme [Gammaproteobacteria bacterium]
MNLTFDIAGNQINGAREYQEDAFLVTRLGDHGTGDFGSLVILADGMGGHAAGHVASNMVVQACNTFITSRYPCDDVIKVLRESALRANEAITDTIKETAALAGMGCTLVAVLLEKNSLFWVSVGDSHLYLLRDGKLEKKNADHSYGGFLSRMAQEGKEVEPDPSFGKAMLMSALMGEEIPEIDCSQAPFELKQGDRLIVSSDGLDTLSAQEIQDCLGTRGRVKECAEALLKAVEAAGAPRQDNTTVVVIEALARAPANALEVAEERDSDFPSHVPSTDAIPTEAAALPEEPDARRFSFPKWFRVAIPVVLLLTGGLWWMGSRQEPEPGTTSVTTSEPAEAKSPETVSSQVTAPATPSLQATPTPSRVIPPRQEVVRFTDSLTVGGKAPEMIWIPDGAFTMGSPSSTLYFDERPEHEVTIGRFAISAHEITLHDYRRFRGISEQGSGGNYPVVNVSWDDADRYARWLSHQTGRKYRLPSEAEWEYAASSGLTTPYWWGSTVAKDRAHCFGCGNVVDPGSPIAVGTFQANPFGLYDTAGNVWEWVHDCYHESYQGAPTDGSAWKTKGCNERIARGGSFRSPPKSIRSQERGKFSPSQGYEDVGFRVVREP